ncbi:MAG: hypothetical protein KC713_07210 [Candidatus Omnitrophica bacterium]|nr:hypothetical protein [Candidatus Omnitrophota bacterium]
MMVFKNIEQHQNKKADIYLIISLILPPLAWFAHLNIGFMWSAYACSMKQFWLLHGFCLLAFGLSVLGVILSWRACCYYRKYNKKSQWGKLFVSILALLLAMIYSISIVAYEFPQIMLEFCR